MTERENKPVKPSKKPAKKTKPPKAIVKKPNQSKVENKPIKPVVKKQTRPKQLKSMKGGSESSDAVTQNINEKTFCQMDAMFDNILGGGRVKTKVKPTRLVKKTKSKVNKPIKKNIKPTKGGSIESDAVTSLVSPSMFEKMNCMHDNTFVGGRRTSKTISGGSIWGEVMDQFASHFTGHKGGNRKHQFEFQNLANYQNDSLGTNVTNRKGGGRGGCTHCNNQRGGCSQCNNGNNSQGGSINRHKGGSCGDAASALSHARPVGLDYSAISTSSHSAGHVMNTPLGSSLANNLMTDSSIAGDAMPTLSKMAQFGANAGMSFSYGGSARKPRVNQPKGVKTRK